MIDLSFTFFLILHFSCVFLQAEKFVDEGFLEWSGIQFVDGNDYQDEWTMWGRAMKRKDGFFFKEESRSGYNASSSFMFLIPDKINKKFTKYTGRIYYTRKSVIEGKGRFVRKWLSKCEETIVTESESLVPIDLSTLMLVSKENADETVKENNADETVKENNADVTVKENNADETVKENNADETVKHWMHQEIDEAAQNNFKFTVSTISYKLQDLIIPVKSFNDKQYREFSTFLDENKHVDKTRLKYSYTENISVEQHFIYSLEKYCSV